MATEPIKRQILISIGTLNISLDRNPSIKKVQEVCAAAKLLRNRLLREHSRISDRIESLRQSQLFNEDDSEQEDEFPSESSSLTRHEYILISEMMVAEKIVVPLLLAHGMKFSDTLLPQLLKLLAALFSPIPRFSTHETLQQDLLKRAKVRCGTNEFFAFLVQSVAPVAEKRANGSLQREDVILLEVILTLIGNLLDGEPRDIENIVGAFCRNHGIELLLVVVNQNFSKMDYSENKVAESASLLPENITDNIIDVVTESADNDNIIITEEENNNNINNISNIIFNEHNNDNNKNISNNINNNTNINLTEVEEIHLTTDDEDELILEEDEDEDHVSIALEKQFEERIHELLESPDQIWKWNTLVTRAISKIMKCVSSSELASLSFLGESEFSYSNDLLSLLRDKKRFQECKNEKENWRFIAKSRNGAMNSNSVLVRLEKNSEGMPENRAIGTVSALYGNRRKDPIETLKEVDLRKRGRFIKGMFQDNTRRCDLPLPTKIQLSQQSESFLCYGFEPLSSMTWIHHQRVILDIERSAKEYKEMVSGYKGSGEAMEITSPLDANLYKSFLHVIDYMCICTSLLQYVREAAGIVKNANTPMTIEKFNIQWRSVSVMISLDHLEAGFTVLRSFLQCKDLRRRSNILYVTDYLGEMLLVLNLLLDGQIIQDPTVEVAAHALASSVLYKEENIKAIFDLLNEYANRNIGMVRAQAFTMFISSVFQLMEKCSYKGSLILPKRAKRQRGVVNSNAEDDGDADSVISGDAEEHDKMMEDMKDMIDDRSETDDVSVHEDAEPNEIMASPEETNEFHHDHDDNDDTGAVGRAPSEAHPGSIASLAPTVVSTAGSERQVAIGSYVRRLATTKNMGLLYSTLRHWRINDAEVNLALTYLMNCLIGEGLAAVFFNIGFLLLFRDVIVHGKKSHAPLYDVCDKLVYEFFNPAFAIDLDSRIGDTIDPNDTKLLSGSQSFLGFEVALRCGRSLFHISPTDYSVLEEKAMPHMMEFTGLDLPDAPRTEQEQEVEDAPKRKKRRKTKKTTSPLWETTSPAEEPIAFEEL